MNLLMTYWHGLVYALLVIVLVGYGWMMLSDARPTTRPTTRPGHSPRKEKPR